MQEDLSLLHPAMAALPADSPERVKHYKDYVQQFVAGLQEIEEISLFKVMGVAWAYPNDVLVLACGKWRAVVMKKACIKKKMMAKLCTMVKMQRLLETDYGSRKYMLCARKCATVIMDTLDSIPDSGQFAEVIGVFPPGAVYCMLTTRREEFITRFGSIFDVETLPVSRQFWLVNTLRRMMHKNPKHVMQDLVHAKTLKLRLL
jgi:hypothetical protein